MEKEAEQNIKLKETVNQQYSRILSMRSEIFSRKELTKRIELSKVREQLRLLDVTSDRYPILERRKNQLEEEINQEEIALAQKDTKKREEDFKKLQKEIADFRREAQVATDRLERRNEDLNNKDEERINEIRQRRDESYWYGLAQRKALGKGGLLSDMGKGMVENVPLLKFFKNTVNTLKLAKKQGLKKTLAKTWDDWRPDSLIGKGIKSVYEYRKGKRDLEEERKLGQSIARRKKELAKAKKELEQDEKLGDALESRLYKGHDYNDKKSGVKEDFNNEQPFDFTGEDPMAEEVSMDDILNEMKEMGANSESMRELLESSDSYTSETSKDFQNMSLADQKQAVFINEENKKALKEVLMDFYRYIDEKKEGKKPEKKRNKMHNKGLLKGRAALVGAIATAVIGTVWYFRDDIKEAFDTVVGKIHEWWDSLFGKAADPMQATADEIADQLDVDIEETEEGLEEVEPDIEEVTNEIPQVDSEGQELNEEIQQVLKDAADDLDEGPMETTNKLDQETKEGVAKSSPEELQRKATEIKDSIDKEKEVQDKELQAIIDKYGGKKEDYEVVGKNEDPLVKSEYTYRRKKSTEAANIQNVENAVNQTITQNGIDQNLIQNTENNAAKQVMEENEIPENQQGKVVNLVDNEGKVVASKTTTPQVKHKDTSVNIHPISEITDRESQYQERTQKVASNKNNNYSPAAIEIPSHLGGGGLDALNMSSV